MPTLVSTASLQGDLTVNPVKSHEISHMLDVMCAHHARLQNICDMLESIADSLPANIDVSDCLAVARTLPKTIKAAHSFEEEVFFPLVKTQLPHSETLTPSIKRLMDEHREDDSFAEEVAEALTDIGMCLSRQGSEATGYILRGLFETLRRHLAFEHDVFIAPLKAVLGQEPANHPA